MAVTVANDGITNVWTVTLDGTNPFDGAAHADSLWTKGGYLKRVTWVVPALSDPFTLRSINATGTPLIPTLTMDLDKTGNVYFDNLFCYPYIKGTEVANGTVVVFEFVPKE